MKLTQWDADAILISPNGSVAYAIAAPSEGELSETIINIIAIRGFNKSRSALVGLLDYGG